MDIKKIYKELALKFHPDVGGNEQIMTAINRAYADGDLEILGGLYKGFIENNSNDLCSCGKEKTENYKKCWDCAVKDMDKCICGKYK